MYCIIKDGVEIAAVDKLRYIRLNQKNGCYVLTTEEQAQGIAVQGTPYNLHGKSPMDGLDTVFVIERDEVVSQADLEKVKEEAGSNPDGVTYEELAAAIREGVNQV